MTDLERRALLGDQKAQEECTRRGIVLPCPFCGGVAMIEYDTVSQFEYNVFCGDCGVMLGISEDKQVAISEWNTRPAPPIGRCGECAYWDKTTGECADAADTEVAYHKYTDPDFFCGDFKPKGGEENG